MSPIFVVAPLNLHERFLLQVNMNSVWVRWLLVSTVIIQVITTVQCEEPITVRYNNTYGHIKLNKKIRTHEINHGDGSRLKFKEVSPKIRLRPVHSITKNSSKPSHFTLKISRGNVTTINGSNKFTHALVANANTRTTTNSKFATTRRSKIKTSTQSNIKILNSLPIKFTSVTTKLKRVSPTESTIVNVGNITHYKNYTKFRIKHKFPSANLKQYDTLPNPMPEISTHSPEVPIGGVFLNNDYQDVGSDAVVIDSASSTSGPLTQVLLQSLPNPNSNDNCPTMQVSSYVYGPQRQEQRQGCSDLNVVINSHIHQNVVTERIGAGVQNSEPVGAPLADPGVVEDAGPVNDVPAAAPAAAPSAGSAPGQGGGLPQFPNLPQLPNLPEIKFPDVKGLLDLLRFLGTGLSYIFGFLTNPYLYIVPAVLSFLLGFFKILGMFPWWIFPLFLFWGGKEDASNKVTYYKHIHKPIHHHGGWFYNHNTKSWMNIFDYVKNSRNTVGDNINRMIHEFHVKHVRSR